MDGLADGEGSGPADSAETLAARGGARFVEEFLNRCCRRLGNAACTRVMKRSRICGVERWADGHPAMGPTGRAGAMLATNQPRDPAHVM